MKPCFRQNTDLQATKGSEASKQDIRVSHSGVKLEPKPGWFENWEPDINTRTVAQQKRFREDFHFRKDIQSQSSKIVCPP